MIAYDSTECEYVWFHNDCANLLSDFEPGDAEWFCPDRSRNSDSFLSVCYTFAITSYQVLSEDVKLSIIL